SSSPFVPSRLRDKSFLPTFARSSPVCPETEEPVLFGETIHPVLFGDLVAGVVLAVAAGHRLELGHSGASFAVGGVARAVLQHELLHQVGALQYDAAAGGLGRELAEVLQILRVAEDRHQVAAIVGV